MGSTQREEMVPAPPPYAPVDAGARNGGAAISSTMYAPPLSPPPGVQNHQGSSIYAPPPGPPPPATNGDHLAPPPLSEAPPTYEPFSFADEHAADLRRRGPNYAQPKGGFVAPRWHGPPVYNVYHDSSSSVLTFHLSLPSTMPPCACGADFQCQCGRRRPAVWHASKSGLSAKRKITLLRLSPFSGTSTKAFVASRSALSTSQTLSVRGERDHKVTEVLPTAIGKTFKFVDGQYLTWQRRGARLELLNQAELPLAILHTNVVPTRLELTAFTWARMPSDELECDFPRCSLQPLYGFVFRCRDCTEQGLDSFDICEPHLVDECARHDPTHHFERLPRPFGQWDDQVHETPLLHMRDMDSQRQSQELVILTLACALLEKER